MKISAQHVRRLLENKHAKDVYVSECKNGPTWLGSHLRLDGWAMKRSWSSPLVTGYEIKVSRSDFIQDQKYLEYRAYCDVLYLVAPKGVLMLEELPLDVGYMIPSYIRHPEELPLDVGYMMVSSTGTRLLTKKKAIRRDEPLPEELYRYILMSRVQIVSDHDQQRLNSDQNKKWFEDWLKKRELNHELGRRVSKALREEIRKRVIEAEWENERLKREHENLREIRDILEELGLSGISKWRAKDTFQKEYNQRINGAKIELSENLKSAIASLEYLSEKIEVSD